MKASWIIFTLLGASEALLSGPRVNIEPQKLTARFRVATAASASGIGPGVASAATTAVAAAAGTAAAARKAIEKSLEALTGDPQALLEAVVGLPFGVATYDRPSLLDYFSRRPTQMVARALDFLLAYRRIAAAWDSPPGSGVDRGAVLRAELALLGPVAVKVGQTLSQRPDILPEDVCRALKALQTANKPFSDAEAFQVMAEDFKCAGRLAPGFPLPDGADPSAPPLFAALSKTCVASASLGQVCK